MNTVGLILKKDLKRYNWALITLAVISLIEIYSFGTNTGMQDLKLNQALQFLSSTIGGLLFFFTIVMVVQEETLSDPDAYWLGRPLNRLHILGAKVSFLGIMLGIAAAGEVASLILNQGSSRLAYALISILSLGLAIWLWQIFLAAQTRSLPRYLLLLVALVVGFYSLVALLAFTASDLGLEAIGLLPANLPGHYLALIQILFWLGAGAFILTFYYLRRSKLAAWACLLPTCFLAAMLTPKNSYFGKRFGFQEEDALQLKLIELKRYGSMHTNGTEYVSYAGIFEPLSTEDDVWVTPQYVNVKSGSRELEVTANTSCQSLEPSKRVDQRAVEIKLFSIERDTLNSLEGPVTIRFGYNISTSTQKEIARLPVEPHSGLAYDGNRLILQSYYTSDSKSTIELDGYLPSFVLEPTPATPVNEPLMGKFSFDISRISDGRILYAEAYREWNGMGKKTSARLEVENFDEDRPEDYEIIVYAREIEESDRGYFGLSDEVEFELK